MYRRIGVAAVLLALVLGGCSQAQDGVASGPATRTAGSETLVAAGGAPTVLVLDSSGSMAEKEASGVRMDAAKTAASGLVDALPDDAVLGLVAYGTGTGSSEAEKPAGCADVKTLREATRLDRGAVAAAITGLTPSGYTPIGASLRKAADLLPAQGDSAIVLLSDGEDTCAPPAPCEVARELKAQRPGLAISTVGFKTANDELACIAQATGGLYLTADNADQLVTRLVAARDVSGNASALTPTGFLGVELGQTHDAISAAHPDFPALTGGATVEVVWMDCTWVFQGGVLTEIRPGASSGFRTVDGLAAGMPVSKAVGLYGEAVSKQANPDGSMASVFTASEAAGTGWRIGHQGDAITTIYLCKCLPRASATSAAPQPQGVEVVGGTTIKQVPLLKPDGSPGPTLAQAETTPANSSQGFVCSEDPLFSGLSRCGAARSDWIMDFCAVFADKMYCPQLATTGGLTPTFSTAAVTGPASGHAQPLPGQVPWAVELSDGSRCVYKTGMGSARPNAGARYRCDGSAEWLWQVSDGPVFTESGNGWTAQAGEDALRPPLYTVDVTTAIFLTAG